MHRLFAAVLTALLLGGVATAAPLVRVGERIDVPGLIDDRGAPFRFADDRYTALRFFAVSEPPPQLPRVDTRRARLVLVALTAATQSALRAYRAERAVDPTIQLVGGSAASVHGLITMIGGPTTLAVLGPEGSIEGIGDDAARNLCGLPFLDPSHPVHHTLVAATMLLPLAGFIILALRERRARPNAF